ncbi:MAG TPA: hypothetical protein VHL80_18045 [Polyangia bacterium]|nr:hypothetical protein [Polyangia bacterium]
MTTRATTFAVTGLAALAVPLLAAGCFKQAVVCPALDSCGGNLPVGDWALDPQHPSCSEDLYTPPVDPRLINADLPPARTPPPEPALYDWCDQLVTSPNVPTPSPADEKPAPSTTNSIVARLPTFAFMTFPIGSAVLHYDANRNYVLSTTRTGTYSLDFPAYCMRAFGAVDTKFDPNGLAGMTGSVCQKLEATLRVLAPVQYRNIACEDDQRDPPGQNGCICGFDVYDRQVSAGTVILSGSDMLHLPGDNFPEDTTFCATANATDPSMDRLELTGADGAYLFDREGLRTLSLGRVSPDCTNGKQDLGEDGLDCGPACPFVCPDCSNLKQDPGEDGVDCGARCPMACPTM